VHPDLLLIPLVLGWIALPAIWWFFFRGKGPDR
jgi:hypothetical protein